MSIKTFSGAAFLVLAALPAPAWTPDPAQAGRLAAPVSVGGFRVRPPRGYEGRTIRAGKGPAFAWAGPPRARGLRPFIIFGRFVPPAAAGGKPSLSQMLSGFAASDAKIYPQYAASPIESGLVNGVPFVRLRWSGTDARTRRGLRGFDYLGRSGGAFFLIGSEVPADDTGALALTEASALTFRPR